jgi:hypothetical protein
VIKWGE